MAKDDKVDERTAALYAVAKSLRVLALSSANTSAQRGDLAGPAWVQVAHDLGELQDALIPPPVEERKALELGRAVLGSGSQREHAIAEGQRVIREQAQLAEVVRSSSSTASASGGK